VLQGVADSRPTQQLPVPSETTMLDTPALVKVRSNSCCLLRCSDSLREKHQMQHECCKHCIGGCCNCSGLAAACGSIICLQASSSYVCPPIVDKTPW
jgi:hypothetical protein